MTKFRANRILRWNDNENLTGMVQGKKASDLEERWARSHYKTKTEFQFQYLIATAISIPREDRNVDFISNLNGTQQAFEIDGEIGHKTVTQIENDQMRDIFVNEALEKMGVKPIIRIPWTKLETQEMSDLTFKEYV